MKGYQTFKPSKGAAPSNRAKKADFHKTYQEEIRASSQEDDFPLYNDDPSKWLPDYSAQNQQNLMRPQTVENYRQEKDIGPQKSARTVFNHDDLSLEFNHLLQNRQHPSGHQKKYGQEIDTGHQNNVHAPSKTRYYSPSEKGNFLQSYQNPDKPEMRKNYDQEINTRPQKSAHPPSNRDHSPLGFGYPLQSHQNLEKLPMTKNYIQEINFGPQKSACPLSNRDHSPEEYGIVLPKHQNPSGYQKKYGQEHATFDWDKLSALEHGNYLPSHPNSSRPQTIKNSHYDRNIGYQNSARDTSTNYDRLLSNEIPSHTKNSAQNRLERFEEQKTTQTSFISRQKLFQDPEFPHNDASILGKDLQDPDDDSALTDFKGAEWEPYLQDLQIFLDGVECRDVVQTLVGDCYLLCVLSALAEKKNRILDLFKTHKVNKEGRYQVISYYMGMKEIIELDSYLPVKKNEQGEFEIFTGTNGREGWVLLYEKCFAKKFGSYAAIEGGGPTEAMIFATGAPAQSFKTSDLKNDLKTKDYLWGLLKQKNTEYLFTCGTADGKDLKEKLEAQGLVTNHAFTIISAFVNKKGDQLLVVRNPWSRTDGGSLGEWTGRYSDLDMEWIESLKTSGSNYQKEDDGIFHMEYNDFLEYFDSIEVCYLHRGFDLQSKETFSNSNQEIAFPLTIERKATSFYVMVNQESYRRFPKKSGFKPSKIDFQIYNSRNQLILKQSGYDQQVWGWLNLLAPGEYQIRVKVEWSQFALKNQINYFVLNTYGPPNIQLGRQL